MNRTLTLAAAAFLGAAVAQAVITVKVVTDTPSLLEITGTWDLTPGNGDPTTPPLTNWAVTFSEAIMPSYGSSLATFSVVAQRNAADGLPAWTGALGLITGRGVQTGALENVVQGSPSNRYALSAEITADDPPVCKFRLTAAYCVPPSSPGAQPASLQSTRTRPQKGGPAKVPTPPKEAVAPKPVGAVKE